MFDAKKLKKDAWKAWPGRCLRGSRKTYSSWENGLAEPIMKIQRLASASPLKRTTSVNKDSHFTYPLLTPISQKKWPVASQLFECSKVVSLTAYWLATAGLGHTFLWQRNGPWSVYFDQEIQQWFSVSWVSGDSMETSLIPMALLPSQQTVLTMMGLSTPSSGMENLNIKSLSGSGRFALESTLTWRFICTSQRLIQIASISRSFPSYGNKRTKTQQPSCHGRFMTP